MVAPMGGLLEALMGVVGHDAFPDPRLGIRVVGQIPGGHGEVGGVMVHPNDWVYPQMAVLPMGFSWASFVAQGTLLGILERARLGADQALAASNVVPADLHEAFALATDDVMLFSDRGAGA